jgi:hypothetical protein
MLQSALDIQTPSVPISLLRESIVHIVANSTGNVVPRTELVVP